MVKYTLKYIHSYKNGQHAIPLDHMINAYTTHGKSIICNSPGEIVDIVKEHLREGWKYVCREEVIPKMDYIIYFSKERDRREEHIDDSIFSSNEGV